MAHHELLEQLIQLDHIHALTKRIVNLERISDDLLAAALETISPDHRDYVRTRVNAWNAKEVVKEGEGQAIASDIRAFVAMEYGIRRRGAEIMAFAERVEDLRTAGVEGTISDQRLRQFGDVPLNTPGQRASGE
ncbi:hypothetical protein HY411_00820 [Candidatus Gottesmanbacteria bacterium]|nr:hypothetical protein [Candidatus Gottesmanbacteria bacterium]